MAAKESGDRNQPPLHDDPAHSSPWWWWLPSLSVLLLSFASYSSTASEFVQGGDSGELMAMACAVRCPTPTAGPRGPCYSSYLQTPNAQPHTLNPLPEWRPASARISPPHDGWQLVAPPLQLSQCRGHPCPAAVCSRPSSPHHNLPLLPNLKP